MLTLISTDKGELQHPKTFDSVSICADAMYYYFAQRPTLQYDGLHDRALKHYFSHYKVRIKLTQMEPVSKHWGYPKVCIDEPRKLTAMEKFTNDGAWSSEFCTLSREYI